MNCPTDIWNMITEYKTGLYFDDVQCQLKQRFLHDRLMQEIFYNRYKIYERFAEKEPIVYQDFTTRGEDDLDHLGYGDQSYMEDYWQRFEILACEDPDYYNGYFESRFLADSD